MPSIIDPFAMIFLKFNDPPKRRIIMILRRLSLMCDKVELSIGRKHSNILALAIATSMSERIW